MKCFYWGSVLLFCLCLVVTIGATQQKEGTNRRLLDPSIVYSQTSTNEKAAKRTLDTLLAQRYQITDYTILDFGVNTSPGGEDCYWFRCQVSEKPIPGQGIPHTPNALSDMPRVIVEGNSTPKALPRAQFPENESSPKAESNPNEQGRTSEENSTADLTEESTFYVYQDRLYLENPLENSKKVP